MKTPYQLKFYTFLLLALLCLIPGITPQIGLLLGITFALTLGNPWHKRVSHYSKILLQIAVVGIGFGLNFANILNTAQYAAWFTAITIAATMFVGMLLGKLFHVKNKTSLLISAGTAICGGSAIAAMAPTINAKNKHTTVALASVFLLNSGALLLLPIIGRYFEIPKETFGIWAAMAIHDTSSVIGATVDYGSAALALGITVKLTRALWIVPLTFTVSCFRKKKKKSSAPFPAFLLAFLAASLLNTFVPQGAFLWTFGAAIAKQLLTLTLFLVGSGLTRNLIRKVGLRAFAQALLLWIFICITTLLAIKLDWMLNLGALVSIVLSAN